MDKMGLGLQDEADACLREINAAEKRLGTVIRKAEKELPKAKAAAFMARLAERRWDAEHEELDKRAW